MNPRVMDAVGFISRFVADHWESIADSGEILDELMNQGFSNREISNAFKWIEENTLGSDLANGTDEDLAPPFSIRPPHRVLSPIERSKITPSAQGLLMRYYERGLLEAVLLEEIIERIMRSESEDVGDKEVKRITALTLFNRVQSDWRELLHSTNTLVH